MARGRLWGLGVGPGDPELITVKALRLLRASPVVAYLVAKGKKGNAFSIIEVQLRPELTRLPRVFPVTTEYLAPPLSYESIIASFYDAAARDIAGHLDEGRDVAVICEGDPFFYGSFMYLHDRLADRYETEVVPGICSVLAGASVLGAPLAYRNQSLAILSGVLPEAELETRLRQSDAAAIMKLGANFDKARRVVTRLGLADRALYIERATMDNQRSLPLAEVDPKSVPYFAMILIPGERWQGNEPAVSPSRGKLAVIGLGPGDAAWMTPEARAALDGARDILGYETYVRMAGPYRPDQTIHPSDNREEMDRARHALDLAAEGKSVALVSSGDPGIFAMAAAVMEALHDASNPAWGDVDVTIVPGVSAAQGAAARAGAPLGHDFCVISLSDNLKPWDVIERRLDFAATADLAMALYNPVSRARPWQLGRAIEIIRTHRAPETPVVLGRDVGRPDEKMRIIKLIDLTPDQVDMRTVILIGSSTTQIFAHGAQQFAYTPRWYGKKP